MHRLSLLCIALLIATCSPSSAAEKTAPKLVKPSRISYVKGPGRERLFTEWMTHEALIKFTEAKKANGEQFIYFEFDDGKGLFRAIFTKEVQFNGWFRSTPDEERNMEIRIRDNRAKGFEPRYIVPSGTHYCMMFVRPEQLAAGWKVLEPLGVEPPVVR